MTSFKNDHFKKVLPLLIALARVDGVLVIFCVHVSNEVLLSPVDVWPRVKGGTPAASFAVGRPPFIST